MIEGVVKKVNEVESSYLGSRTPSNCDRSVDNRDKNEEEMGRPRIKSLGNRQAISTLPSAGKGTAPPRIKWFVGGADLAWSCGTLDTEHRAMQCYYARFKLIC